MTQLEQDALICLHYKMYCSLPEMARYVVSEWELAAEFNPDIVAESAETYQQVLEAMLARGWLRIVREQRERRRKRWTKAGWLVPLADNLPEKGDLDFTTIGWQYYRETARLDDTLVWVDEEAKTYNIVAKSAKACQQWREWADDPFGGGLLDMRTTYPIQHVATDVPVKVGKWFDREQQRHRAGWKLTVHFRRVRRRRVLLPELAVDAWLEPWEFIKVEGKVAGTRFYFSQEVCAYPRDIYHYTPTLTVYVKNNHFHWQSPDELPEPMTSEQAIVALRQGIQAWHRQRQTPRGL